MKGDISLLTGHINTRFCCLDLPLTDFDSILSRIAYFKLGCSLKNDILFPQKCFIFGDIRAINHNLILVVMVRDLLVVYDV